MRMFQWQSFATKLNDVSCALRIIITCVKRWRAYSIADELEQETVLRIKDAFGIKAGNTVMLSSSSLDVCKGNEVVIDSSAYPFLWTVLDEVNVIAGETNDPEGTNSFK